MSALASTLFVSAISPTHAIAGCPSGNAIATGNIRGTYNFALGGNIANDAANGPVAGTGYFSVDGNGNVISGFILLNCQGENTGVFATGGCYSINGDGTGFMSLALSGSVCSFSSGPPFSTDSGVDLDLAVNANTVSFSSDASDRNFNTGALIPFTGVANQFSQRQITINQSKIGG